MQNDIFSMAGKTVVFTGGCGNLGKVMVKALLDYGANVAVPNRSDKFDASYDSYKAAGKLVVIPADLKSTEDTKKAFLKAEELFGKIDVIAVFNHPCRLKGSKLKTDFFQMFRYVFRI